jgi:pimeloyl-ACP methyl ester carboxylesterase
MATFVLVHGGGHGGWCYQPVTQRLRALGHEVHAPSLTGLGERAHLLPVLGPHIDLTTHVTDIVDYLHYNDLREVILVGHSYGGMVITGAADRAARRVGRLVYLDAANPQDGQSLLDVAGPMMLAAREFGEIRDGVELVLLPGEGAGVFYGVTDPGDLAWMDTRLTAHPWACFEQKLVLTNPAGLAALPAFHVVCTSTIPTRDPGLIKDARDKGRLWDIDTGHDLMITEPDRVTEALLEIAASPD